MKIRVKKDLLKSVRITASTLLLLATVFFIQSCSNDDHEKVDYETIETRQSDQYVPIELYCEFTCVRGGFKVSVWKNELDLFKYTFHPLDWVFVNHDFHINNSTDPFPYPYAFHNFLGNATNTNDPTLDVFGDPINGPLYQYVYVGSNTLNRCSSSYSTLFYHLQGNDPCDQDLALYYLNNCPNKPDEDCELSCPSVGWDGGGYVPPTYDPAPSPIILTNKYGKLCQEDQPGFCYIDINDPPIDDPIIDPSIGPSVFSYVNDNELKISFYNDVKVPYLDVTAEDNKLDDKVISWFGLSPSTTIKLGEYPIIHEESGNEHGYSIIKLDSE